MNTNNNQSEEVERLAEDVYQKFLKHTKDRTRAYLDNHNNPAGHEWFVGLISESLTTHGASEYARGKSEERERIENEFAKVAKYTQDCEPDGYGEAVNTSYWNIYEGQWEYIISQENTLKE